MPTSQGSGSSEGYGEVVDADGLEDPFVQNIFVLRHGEVADEGSGLSERGKVQAWRVGRLLRLEEWNITRVVVSPLLRCVQTATEVLAGLCLRPCSVQGEGAGAAAAAAAGGTPSSTPSIKASIECGFVKRPFEGADKCVLDLAELYSLLPQEFHDANRQMVSTCRVGEADTYLQYIPTLQKIANKFHSENILCITHGEGVIQSATMMWPHVEIYEVDYCAYIHAQRPNFKRVQQSNLKQDTYESILSGEWELLTESGSASGIFFNPTRR